MENLKIILLSHIENMKLLSSLGLIKKHKQNPVKAQTKEIKDQVDSAAEI